MSENGTASADTALPTGWAWVSLDHLGTWTGGGTPRKSVSAYWTGDLPWVSPKDMKSVRLADTQDHISDAAVDESAAMAFSAKSIAFVVRSGILNHTLPIALVPFRAAANQDMKILTPAPEINPEWLLYALLAAAPDIRERCRKDGTTVASIEFPRLKSYRIGVPPRAEQDRIANRLEAVLHSLAAADQDCGRARSGLQVFRSAVLERLFKLGAPEVPIGEVGEVFVGATPARNDAGNWEGGIPWVSSGEVAFCRIRTTRETITAAGLGNRQRRLHPAGTVLLAMIGEGKTRGQAAILDVPAAHNQNSAAIRPDSSRMVPAFLYYCLMARYESNRRRGGGSQQPALNGGLVREIRVPCPELNAQRLAVHATESALSLLAGVESDLDRLGKATEQLRMSALKHGARGRLDASVAEAR